MAFCSKVGNDLSELGERVTIGLDNGRSEAIKPKTHIRVRAFMQNERVPDRHQQHSPLGLQRIGRARIGRELADHAQPNIIHLTHNRIRCPFLQKGFGIIMQIWWQIFSASGRSADNWMGASSEFRHVVRDAPRHIRPGGFFLRRDQRQCNHQIKSSPQRHPRPAPRRQCAVNTVLPRRSVANGEFKLPGTRQWACQGP